MRRPRHRLQSPQGNLAFTSGATPERACSDFQSPSGSMASQSTIADRHGLGPRRRMGWGLSAGVAVQPSAGTAESTQGPPSVRALWRISCRSLPTARRRGPRRFPLASRPAGFLGESLSITLKLLGKRLALRPLVDHHRHGLFDQLWPIANGPDHQGQTTRLDLGGNPESGGRADLVNDEAPHVGPDRLERRQESR